MAWFNEDAAKRVLADLKNNPSYDYAKHAPAIEKMIAEHENVKTALEVGDAASKAGAVKIYEAYRSAMLANPVLDFDRILCIHRKLKEPRKLYGPWDSRQLGLMRLNAENHSENPRTGFKNEIIAISDLRGSCKRTVLFEPADGTSVVRDLDLDFDASRILFTTYRGTNDLFGVYEIPAEGAKEAKLVSPAEHLDVQWWDGCYLPNKDQIILLGTAAFQFLPCEDGNMLMSVLYRLDRKTGEVRQLTFEQDSDYTPSITHDGRVMYTRWEYSDLAHYFSRELMTMNPDGVGQLALWGSGSYAPTFFHAARSIPGEPHKLTMVGSGHHDRAEMGRYYIVDPTLARAYPFKYDAPDRDWGPAKHTLRIPNMIFPKEMTGLVHEFPGFGKDVEGDTSDPFSMNQFARGKPYFMYPWPLDGKYSISTVKLSESGLFGIYLVDVFDNITLITEVEDGMLFEVIPFTPRTRPPVIPDRSVKGRKTCSVHIADIYTGPGLAGVPRGTVKKLRLFSYHYNYHKTGGHSMTGLDRVESSWDVKRILGTVDVEEDGSVCFEMPANTPISIQPLDAQGRAVQLMRSWVVGMPGERVSCTGCHEDNRSSVQTKRTIADEKYVKGEIQKIKPTDDDGVRPWGFANELWPVVKKNCTYCHGNENAAPLAMFDQGGFSATAKSGLSGKRILMKDAESAYRTLHPYIRRPGPESELPVLTPMDYHASTSPLVQMLLKGHHGVKLEAAEYRKLYEWIDLNAPFFGKWNPPSLAVPDKWLFASVPDQVARRCELSIQYANVSVNPEKEHDDYAKIVASREVNVKVPEKCGQETNAVPKLKGWPMGDLDVAKAQLGAINEIAPVTTKTLILSDGQSLTFRRIPAGTFVMGSGSGYPDEKPQSVVTVDKPFWISEMEIRNDQYNAFDPEHDSRYQDEFERDHVFPGYVGNHRRMPVVRVSWNEAMAFCEWLSKKCGVKATLPTEAQWEWAARAGTDTKFPWGGLNDDFTKFANLADKDTRFQKLGWDGMGAVRTRNPIRIEQNFPLHEERWTDDWFCLNFVGRANCNRWGLYDMHGNAAEWTRSDYMPYPYDDGDGRNSCNKVSRKVVRGGSFASRPRDATSSYRTAYEPWQKVFDTGFRVVIEEE